MSAPSAVRSASTASTGGTGGAVAYRLLGPLEVERDGELVPLGGPKQRTVLAALLLDAGRVVPLDRLATLVWGDAPDHAATTLQVYVSNLRRALRADESDAVIANRRPGYVATVDSERLDLGQLEALLAQASRHRAAGEGAVAAHLLRLADGMWRGPALADLRDSPAVAALVAPLDRRHAALRRELYDIELELGRHLQLVPELEAAVTEDPYDEQLVGLQVLALYRSGRQADALAAARSASERLAADLGIDAGAALRALEAAVLRQDPGLDLGDRVDVSATLQRDGRGVRGACLVLPNGVELELLSRTWLIGRHPACQVPLTDPEASRRHAEIRAVNDGYLLVDLDSTNGTRVADLEVREHRLVSGDRITIGATTLRYREPPHPA